ncbi:MAG: hypothetical protein NVS9B1_07320 [Candidatus Dormibacteraceae bacterium]
MIQERPRTFTFLINNEVTVVVSGQETDGAYCMLEMRTPPGAGGNNLHTDPFLETFYLLEGELEFTVERDGILDTFRPAIGEAVHIGHAVKHKFTCVGDTAARSIAVGLPSYEEFFRELAIGWPHTHWDPVETPAVFGPIAKRFGVTFFEA